MTLSLRFTALSDVGRVRKDNQDSGYAGPHLLAVADGVGGSARGDVASTAVIQQMANLDAIPTEPGAEVLGAGIQGAHRRIADLVEDNPALEGTSTTATVGLFDGSSLSIVHVGDSRAYLLRDGTLKQLTKDHTFVQSLVDDGRISEDEARIHPHRNLILKAVDGVREPEPDFESTDLQAGDRLLFCSDGCCGSLSSSEIAGLLGSETIDRAAPALVTAALEAGSTDNVTVVVAEVVEDDSADAPMPIQVGAVAHPYRPSGLARLRRRKPDTDPEAVRYAPLPPRRFVWFRRVLFLLVLLALFVAALYGGYKVTQSRYFVGASDNKVVINRGVELSVFGHRLNHVVERSGLSLTALGDFDAQQVRDGIDFDSLAAARARVRELIAKHCAPVPNPAAGQPGAPPTVIPAGCPGSSAVAAVPSIPVAPPPAPSPTPGAP